jgi:hypothetical protein
MPACVSFRAVLGPIPHRASVDRPAMTLHQLCQVSRYIPAGLVKPVASLARSLLSPMPTERPAGDLDRGEELVEIDVQYPPVPLDHLGHGSVCGRYGDGSPVQVRPSSSVVG